MRTLAATEPDFLFSCAALQEPSLDVYRFSGREAMNQPLRFTIELVSTNPNLDLDSAVGQPARLTLRGRHPGGERYTRTVHGIIERLVQLSAGVRYSMYEATLVSTLATLAYDRDSRIFQQLSTPEIIQTVLKDRRIPAGAVQLLLHASYDTRTYCVQYQESSLTFLQRLCEEAGIGFFHDSQSEREVLLLGDGRHAFDALPNHPQIRHFDEPHLYEEGVWEFRAASALTPGSTVLRDFRFKQPSLDMEVSAQAEAYREYEQYYYPGEYNDPAKGQRLAALRLEEQLCGRHRYSGHSNVRALLPGYKFTLNGHRRRASNQEYLIVAIEHTGVQPQALPQSPFQTSSEPGSSATKICYQNRVECIPADVVFRPARVTSRPLITGVQTAVVVGPPGEEIHCDEYGRVNVQFPWDRRGLHNDHSSCWIRVNQPWAGVGQGGMFLPRIGHEVVVQFCDGNPNRPLIIGRVYNGENPLPYELPAQKTISTLRSASTPGGEGYNELRFDDHKGHEQLHLHAQRELSVVVGQNHSHRVAAADRCTVAGSRYLTVNQSLSTVVQSGDHTLRVKGGSSVTEIKGQCKTAIESGNSELWVLTGGHITKAEGPVTIESGKGRLNLLARGPWHGKSKQSATLEAPEINVRASQKLTLSVGQSSITLDDSGVEISAPQITSSAIGTHTLSGALITIN